MNPTEVDIVIDYIKNQNKHHANKTFKEEFIAFLNKYQVEYASPAASLWRPKDDRYVLD